jgi:hypothetical protein
MQDPSTSGSSGLGLVEVALEATSAAGTGRVPGLTLRFDERGLSVHRAAGAPVAEIAWERLRTIELRELAACAPAAVAATTGAGDGRGRVERRRRREGAGAGLTVPSVELTVVTDARSHRFYVPLADLEALRTALSGLAGRYARSEIVGAKARRR